MCTEIHHTTDGGRGWRKAPVPPVTLDRVVFADSRNWFASHRPADWTSTGPELWSTHDGGSTWRRVALPGIRVREYSVEPVVANGTVQVAAFHPYAGEMRIASSPVETDAFTTSDPFRVSVDAAEYRTTSHEFGVARSGSTTWFGGSESSPTRLASPGRDARLVDGRWSTWALPCSGRPGPKLVALSESELLATCVPAPETDPSTHHLFYSSDAGTTFTDHGVLPGSLTAAASAGDLLVAVPDEDDKTALLTSHDGGRTWRKTASPPAPSTMRANSSLTRGQFFTPTVGFAILPYSGQAPDSEDHLYLTRDGGDSWNRVTIR
ncbi:hypothetical protein [Nocardia sp. NPDC051832]|uniref:sialidase family protein n=1 Tax=Nocardia sp. NPDC051832 TaxID=3155673 RepID=UPI00343E7391